MRAKNWGNSLHCLVCDESLRFQVGDRLLTRAEISSIQIEHYWSCDDLHIQTRDGGQYTVSMENGTFCVYDNGHKERYAFCKMESIELGDRDM